MDPADEMPAGGFIEPVKEPYAELIEQNAELIAMITSIETLTEGYSQCACGVVNKITYDYLYPSNT